MCFFCLIYQRNFPRYCPRLRFTKVNFKNFFKPWVFFLNLGLFFKTLVRSSFYSPPQRLGSTVMSQVCLTSHEVSDQFFSRSLFLRYRHLFFSEKRGLRPTGLLPSRGIAPSGFRPLRKIPHCCLP